MFRVAIITACDRCHAGEKADDSGPLIGETMAEEGYEIVKYEILPDDRNVLSDHMRRICNKNEADLILTTGGTGLSPCDVTPEATLEVGHREVPGIAEAMRARVMERCDLAMMSRGVAVTRRKTLIINLPDSIVAVRESLECILPALEHGLEVLTGRTAKSRAPVLENLAHIPM